MRGSDEDREEVAFWGSPGQGPGDRGDIPLERVHVVVGVGVLRGPR